jgi:putative phage-type endonuclease
MEMPQNHDEWLALRLKGIGGSEAAAVIGQSLWCSNVELWKRKTGRSTAPDISNNGAVQYGHDAEPLIRGLFALDYAGKYRTEYINEFDMVHNPEHPYIFATLDGRLTELATGRKGILEIKTTSILRSMQKELWWKDGKPCIPMQYYCQILHQLLATGWDFAILHAQLRYEYGDNPEDIRSERRTYTIERADHQASIDYLKEKEVEFWERYVMQDICPPQILPDI